MNVSRYDIGVAEVEHKGVIVTTNVGTSYDNFLKQLERSQGVVGRIPKLHSNRPDLISDLFYGNVNSWWLLMEYNNVKDPFEGFNHGDNIKIPKL